MIKDQVMQLVPYLHFNGNAEEVLNFYKEALGGEILMINRYGDSPMPVGEELKNKIIHSRLQFGDNNIVMISDSFNGNMATPGGNIQLSLGMTDEAKATEVFNNLAAGGRVTMPLEKQFWGAVFGMLQDKFGTNWMVNCEIKNGN